MTQVTVRKGHGYAVTESAGARQGLRKGYGYAVLDASTRIDIRKAHGYAVLAEAIGGTVAATLGPVTSAGTGTFTPAATGTVASTLGPLSSTGATIHLAYRARARLRGNWRSTVALHATWVPRV